MTDFISWLKTDDAAFRADYLAKTGEHIQDTPIDADTHWEVGSGRLNASMVTEVRKFPLVAATKTPLSRRVYALTELGVYTAYIAGGYLTQLSSISDYFAITYQGGY